MEVFMAGRNLAENGYVVKPQTARPFDYPLRMGRKGTKRVVYSSRYREVLADNLERLMKDRPELDSSPKLKKKTKISDGTINRLRRKETGATIDTIDAIASAYGLYPWQLLVPGFDPKSPPKLGLSPEHQRIYTTFIESLNRLADLQGHSNSSDDHESPERRKGVR